MRFVPVAVHLRSRCLERENKLISTEQRNDIVEGRCEGVALAELGLRGRGEVFLLDSSCVRLISRSSRFLRKDAEAFMAVLHAASGHVSKPLQGHVIIECAPVCSKARKWLQEHGVSVETLYET